MRDKVSNLKTGEKYKEVNTKTSMNTSMDKDMHNSTQHDWVESVPDQQSKAPKKSHTLVTSPRKSPTPVAEPKKPPSPVAAPKQPSTRPGRFSKLTYSRPKPTWMMRDSTRQPTRKVKPAKI